MANTLRSAVIGMGHIGNLHARIHKEQKVSELVAVCDRDRDRADAEALLALLPGAAAIGTIRPWKQEKRIYLI